MEFTIKKHDFKYNNNNLIRIPNTSINMVYSEKMNREYAVCPDCGCVEHQFSAEARDQGIRDCHEGYRAECTWGDGPDVLLNCRGALFDLTSDEAEKLAYSLLNSSRNAKELESLAEQLDKDAENI